MVLYSFFEVALLMLLGLLGAPAFLAVPPLPEDPALLAAAPADTVAYVQWFGRATENPQTSNATEKLIADPQMQHLVARVVAAVRAAVERQAEDDSTPIDALLLVGAALQQPGCAFLSLGDNGATFGGGVVLRVGDDRARYDKFLRRVEAQMLEDGAPANAVADPPAVDGVTFRSLPVPGLEDLAWAVVDDYLVLVVGHSARAAVVAGLRGEAGLAAHPRFTTAHAPARVARPYMRTYLDAERLLALAVEEGGAEVARALAASGLDKLQAVCTEIGLEGDGSVARTRISGAAGPLSELLDDRGVTPEVLAIVPADADVAASVRLQPQKLLDWVTGVVMAADERDGAQLMMMLETVEGLGGVSFEKDLLAHLDGTVTLWNSPGQGGFLGTGLTAALGLSDAPAFAASFTKMMAQLRQIAAEPEPENGRVRRGMYLARTEYKDHVIHFGNTVGDDMVVAPAWCVTDTHLLVSLFPQQIMAVIDRGPVAETSLAGREGLLAGGDVGVAFADARALWRTAYPMLPMLTQLLAGEIQREGIEIDISVLPTMGAIERHLGDEIVRLSLDEGGALLTRTGTVPAGDPLMSLLGPFTFVWVGRTFAMRGAMLRAQAVEARRRQGK